MFQHRVPVGFSSAQRRVLDIGCGRNKVPGAVGLDYAAFDGVDVVADLNAKLPFGDASFEIVHSNQVFEHIPNLIGLIGEIHRVLAPGGEMIAHMPYFRSSWAAVDPTHVRQFSLNSLDYFVKGNYFFDSYRFSNTSFDRIERFLDANYPPSVVRWAFTTLALRWPGPFENSVLSFLYPFQTLTCVLTKSPQ